MAALGRAGSSKDYAVCEEHHCCKICAHTKHVVQGPAKPNAGAQTVLINNSPALRVGDMGQHDKQTCCGDNLWVAQQCKQSRNVFIEGKEAFCVGDVTLHDNKDQGELKIGSNNVFIGEG